MEKIAKSRSLPFLTAKAHAYKRYALDMSDDDFIESAYPVWREIGNTAGNITRFYTKVPDDYIVELPQDCEFLESVSLINELLMNGTFDSAGSTDRRNPAYVEKSNIPTSNQSLTFTPGQSVNYSMEKGAIHITSPDMLNKDIMLVYRAMDLGDDGLPLLNDKEVAGIAAEVTRRQMMRGAFQTVTGNKELYQFITIEADRLMAAAKVDEYINDDAIDKLLDVKTTWDRKVFGRRFNFTR